MRVDPAELRRAAVALREVASTLAGGPPEPVALNARQVGDVALTRALKHFASTQTHNTTAMVAGLRAQADDLDQAALQAETAERQVADQFHILNPH
jgi:hypothetical protein